MILSVDLIYTKMKNNLIDEHSRCNAHGHQFLKEEFTCVRHTHLGDLDDEKRDDEIKKRNAKPYLSRIGTSLTTVGLVGQVGDSE